jgi:aminoglycoside phosphotransferase (APT) family kinase protein
MNRDRLSHLEVVGEGHTTTIYRDGDRALKFYPNAPPGEVEHEARLQRFAADAGLPVPAVYGVRNWDDGAAALEMAYIASQPLLQPGMRADERNRAIAELVKLQTRVHSVDGTGLPSQTDWLRQQVERHLGGAEHALVRERLLTRIGKLDTGRTAVCHGDLHPFNVLFDGERHWVIDWVYAATGDPLADACHTYLVIKEFFSRSAGVYLRMFCRETGARPEDVLAWHPIVAASNLVGQDDKGRAYLMEIIEKALL